MPVTCYICPAEATGRLTPDLDIEGIPFCEAHKHIILAVLHKGDWTEVERWAKRERRKNRGKVEGG